ncbi:D-2-hydroxyacid dehydrogenase [Vallitalea okinawensis]|uniref:D-2-hydroxyacid dehydrogenase n=1 Tax=Vallitalea okinawensis TaxID=2078660 RepID=UPI000CFCC6A2|nr:D-2-hydroxyacid dehydrogenase [Vallitalea okinawensis]
MKIAILDAKTLGNDLDLTIYEQLGEVKIYDFTRPEQVLDRITGMDVIITNKVVLGEENLSKAPTIKLICVTATGTNNIDSTYCKANKIGVANVAGYSTDSVAQHTFALLFYLLEHLPYYDQYVKSGKYVDDEIFTHFDKKFWQVKDKTWGIIGLGAIGRRVAEIAKLFGANIIYYSTSGQNNNDQYKRVELEELLAESDIISIHSPLNDKTKNLITYTELDRMKRNAILLNLGRGTIVNEADLVKALNEDLIAAAGLDVLEHEPINADNPLLMVKDSNKLFVTPHIAWASLEARQTVVREVYENIVAFTKGEIRNRVEL